MCVAVVEVPIAVAPEADVIEVLNVGFILHSLEHFGQLLASGVNALLIQGIRYFGGCLG